MLVAGAVGAAVAVGTLFVYRFANIEYLAEMVEALEQLVAAAVVGESVRVAEIVSLVGELV